MNRKQLVALWAMALLLCIGLVLSTYSICYNRHPNTLNNLLADRPEDMRGQWTVSKINRIDIVLVNVIRYSFPILIIGGLLLYTLRDKNK